jgi:ribosomal protein S18
VQRQESQHQNMASRFVASTCRRLGRSSGIGRSTQFSSATTPQLSKRFFSDKKGGKAENDDPFGVHFEDGDETGKLGPKIPPKYKRDSMTGKFTGETEAELSEREKKLLSMDPVEEQEYLLNKVLNDWKVSTEDEEGSAEKLALLAKRVRGDNMGLNTLGRSVESQSLKGKLEDGEDSYADETGFSKPLSPSEFNVFKKHMEEQYKTEIDEDDIPVESVDSDDSVLSGYADNEDLNNKWMSSRAMRFMDDTKDDDPFSDLLPSDLSPTRLVNRRQAKRIPQQLLHHNNLALLRRYITPTGQIMNRVQSRLGAKDQRKVAKLIKRARSLGLLPTAGQFAVEARGNIHEKDIHEEKEWEQELVRRGLVMPRGK